MSPENPEKHDENLRKVPRDPEHHSENPPNKFEGKFNDKETMQKPFERLYDYVAAVKVFEQKIKEGVFLEYIKKNQLMMPEKYLDIIKKQDETMRSDLGIEFLKRPDSLEELGNIIAWVNDPIDLKAAKIAVNGLKEFLKRD